MYLLKIDVKHITPIEVMERFCAAETTKNSLLSSGKVETRTFAKVVDLILKDNQLTGTILENVSTSRQETIPVDDVFVFIGQHPNNELFIDQVT